MSKIKGVKLLNLENIFKLIFSLCALALLFAFSVELLLGFKPCILCIYERIIYGLIMVPSMLFFLFKRAAKYLAILMLFFQLLQTATAFYHVGVERNIFEPTEKCLSDHSLDNLNFEELSAKLMEKRLPSCADAVYLLPYLSMAAANFLFALFLLILTLFLFRKNEIIRR